MSEGNLHEWLSSLATNESHWDSLSSDDQNVTYISSNPCLYLSFKIKADFHRNDAHPQALVSFLVPQEPAREIRQPLGVHALVPVAVELDILLPFKETRSCWERASLHTRIPLPVVFTAEPRQRGREEAKNSRQGAAVFPTTAALICCENIGTVCWVSLGLCASLVWQKLQCQLHPKLTFAFREEPHHPRAFRPGPLVITLTSRLTLS